MEKCFLRDNYGFGCSLVNTNFGCFNKSLVLIVKLIYRYIVVHYLIVGEI